MKKLAYNESGTGMPVVLVHGFCESKSIWNGIRKELERFCRVICPDLPGHGESIPPTFEGSAASFSVEYFADTIHALLDELHIQKCIMIGHSLGGYVTLAFAERYPSYLEAFGFFHSTAFADTEEKKRNRDRTIDFIRKHGMTKFSESFVSPLFYHRNRERLLKDIKDQEHVCASTSEEYVIATVQAMRDRKERIELLKGTDLPVLFIIGKEDSAVPFDKSIEQCRLPRHHEVYILEETGHMGMFEKKQESLEALRDFLKKVQVGKADAHKA